MIPASIDREALRDRIAELDDEGRFHESAALKTALSRPAPVDGRTTAERRDRMDTLKVAIAALEECGAFHTAAPLKTALAHLASDTH